MAPAPNYRKRRLKPSANKNDLKVSREQADDQRKAQAGTLRERFPNVSRLQLELRMETPSGAVLEQSTRLIQPDDSLLLDVPCQGGCGNGLFLLKDAVENSLRAGKELHEGMGLCQAVSYMDPKAFCSTKLFYRIEAAFNPS